STLPRAGRSPCSPSSPTTAAAAITTCGATAPSTCRRSTSTTGPIATSTPPVTSPPTSTPPSCCAPGSSPASSALVLADLDAKGADAVRPLLRAATLRRLARLVERRAGVPAEEAAVLTRFWSWYEGELHASLARYVGGGAAGAAALDDDTERFLAECERLLGGVPPAPQPSGDGALVFGRQPAPKGP